MGLFFSKLWGLFTNEGRLSYNTVRTYDFSADRHVNNFIIHIDGMV